jgi:FKBP-type peptidyl-prolyl cis-trans isomerase SlpA
MGARGAVLASQPLSGGWESEPRMLPGNTVVMHLALRLEDGTEVENTFGREPLRFVVGDGTLAPELERALRGLEPGGRKRILLSPERGFGYPDPANVHVLPRSEFPSDLLLAPGALIGFETPAGAQVPGRIDAISEGGVTVDFNHPLAGHQLILEVQLLSVMSPD